MGTRSRAVVEAYNKGYRVTEDGSVLSPDKSARKTRLEVRRTYRILTFNVSVGSSKVPIAVHRLAAYQKFKERMLEPGVMVRHLNGDSTDNSPANIAIGTASDNARDRSVLDRVMHARKAGSASSLPVSVWDKIEADHKSGIGYKRLSKMYGVAISTLCYRLSRRAKRTKFAVDEFIERQKTGHK